MQLTHRWLPRNVAAFAQTSRRPRGRLPAVRHLPGRLRRTSPAFSGDLLAASDVAGCAIGGLSVGEPKAVMAEMLDASISSLPEDRPRYLMGVGSPEDLWNGVAAGVDMFDCVLPTRVARRGGLFTLRAVSHYKRALSSDGLRAGRRVRLSDLPRAIPQRICITCSAPASCWHIGWHRFITSLHLAADGADARRDTRSASSNSSGSAS